MKFLHLREPIRFRWLMCAGPSHRARTHSCRPVRRHRGYHSRERRGECCAIEVGQLGQVVIGMALSARSRRASEGVEPPNLRSVGVIGPVHVVSPRPPVPLNSSFADWRTK